MSKLENALAVLITYESSSIQSGIYWNRPNGLMGQWTGIPIHKSF